MLWRPYWPPSWKYSPQSSRNYEGSIPWTWYYLNRLLICLCSLSMSWDIGLHVLVCWRSYWLPSWKLTLQVIDTTRDRFLDLESIEIDSSFVFVADLWAAKLPLFGVRVLANVFGQRRLNSLSLCLKKLFYFRNFYSGWLGALQHLSQSFLLVV